jgi:hypothetical protein
MRPPKNVNIGSAMACAPKHAVPLILPKVPHGCTLSLPSGAVALGVWPRAEIHLQ